MGDPAGDLESERTRRAMAGDSAALTEIWERNRPWLASVLVGHCPPGVEVDDLLQEVAVRVVAEIPRLKEPGALRGWLRVIAVNLARSAGRRYQVRSVLVPLGDREAELPDPNHDRQLRRRELDSELARVMDLLSGFDPDYREPLLLKSVHGWSQKRIAETLDLPETTVETRLARARRMLRRKLRQPATAAPGCRPGDEHEELDR